MRLAITVLSVLTALSFLTACGNTKSQTATPTVNLYAIKPLAYCNTSTDTNFAFNTAIVNDQSGQISGDWIKLKFNFLNANITKSGNVIKIFKWRVTGTQTILDQSPLNLATYDFSTGQTNSAVTTSYPADQLNGQYGLYIQLNDPSVVFQAIKIVAYNSAGAVIGNINSLIPTFYANPADYTLNSDGTPRALILQQLHALYQNPVAYNADQFKQYFDQYCF
ncbi:MAG: hypothetical protein WA160_15315 [Pseudobdellovibrio sp.]